MRKKTLFPILMVLTVAILFLVSGCLPGPPADRSLLLVTAVAVSPNELCFVDYEENLAVTDGAPLPFATVIVYGDQGSKIETTTDPTGQFTFTALEQEAYVIYINRDDLMLMKGFFHATPDAGQADYYTTAQVIIWETAGRLYPEELSMRDIPNLLPTDDLLTAVWNALAECGDARTDAQVIGIVEALVNALFGEPTPGVPAFGTATPTPEPTATPEPTPGPTPGPTFPPPFPPIPGFPGFPGFPAIPPIPS